MKVVHSNIVYHKVYKCLSRSIYDMLKGNKFRIYPNKQQIEMLEKHFGASRFIYNKLLHIKKTAYSQYRGNISRIDLSNYVQVLKETYPWLKEVYAHSLISANNNLDRAYTNFFNNGFGYPQFKSKKDSTQSFQIPDSYQINFSNSRIYIPGTGWIKIVLHKDLFDAEFASDNLKLNLIKGQEILKHRKNNKFLRTLTVSRAPSGKYFVSILTEDLNEFPQNNVFSEETTIGIDVGIAKFATFSTGDKIDNPKYLKNSLKKLKVLQKKVSRKVTGSINQRKAVLKLAKIYEKITNQRNDFQHKLSTRLIRENQAIAVETLNIKGMIKNHKLAQVIGDSAWYSFVQKLEYKARWYGKTFFKIGMFEPSSKTCNICGYKLNELSLGIREWYCPSCGTLHDRDVNAAINIKNFVTVGTTGRAYGSMNSGSRNEVGNLITLV